MRLVFLGSGAFALPTLRWLAHSGHDIPLVITQPAKGAGRGRRLTRTPVAAEAESFGMTVEAVEDVNEPSVVSRVAALKADAGVVIAFGQKLGPVFRDTAAGGYINLHASLLPKYRGAAPINWAIIRGEQRTGVTVFRIVERMDAGPILSTRWTEIKPEETTGELHDRLAAIGVDAMKAALDLFASNPCPPGEPQDDSQASKAPKLSKADGRIDFAAPAAEVAARIHGVTPWPGAQAVFEASDGRWEQLAILRARPALPHARAAIPPGTLDPRLYAATGDGFLELLEVKPSSGRVMTWPEYVNGRRAQPGDRLSAPEPARD